MISNRNWENYFYIKRYKIHLKIISRRLTKMKIKLRMNIQEVNKKINKKRKPMLTNLYKHIYTMKISF